MHFAQAADKHVAGFGILFERHGRIFFLEAVEAGNDLILLALFLGGNRKADAGLRELDGFKQHGGGRVAQRIAGVGGLQLGDRAYIAGRQAFDIDAFCRA